MKKTALEPPESDFAARVRRSFDLQRVMETIGARLGRVAAGEVEIELPFREDLTQQHGFLHAGIVTAIADSACGYAAYTLMPAGSAVLSVEYKINLLSPARAPGVVARARVLRRGKTLTVCRADVASMGEADEKLVAVMLGTMIELRDRPELDAGRGPADGA